MHKAKNRIPVILICLLLACLAILFVALNIAPAAASDLEAQPLRVGITLQDSSLKLFFTDGYRLVDLDCDLAMDLPPGEYTFAVSGSGLKIQAPGDRNNGFFGHSFYLQSLGDPANSFFEIKNACNGKKYRGELEIVPGGNSQRVSAINIIDLETYLRGVLAREMPSSWGNYGGEEALKAQAVAARTYALYQLAQRRHSGYHLCDDQHCQVYGGRDAESPQTDLAAMETAGELLTYGGRIIEPVYHATNGGFTEQAENVWGWAFPYFRAEPDPYDDPRNPLGLGNMVTHPHANWEVEIPSGQIRNLLASRGGAYLGSIDRLFVGSSFPSGRVCELILQDSGGKTASLFKEQISTIFGTSGVKSQLFTIREETEPRVWIASHAAGITKKECYAKLEGKWVAGKNGLKGMLKGDFFSAWGPAASSPVPYVSFILEGRGSGHGVGMSQNGAYNRSRQGHDYREILSFYYPGTEINSR